MSAQQQRMPKLSKQYSQQQISLTETNQGENVPSFLLKTYEILQNTKFQDIISWTRNGEGFIVKKVKEFSDTVLPIYFRHNNYTSFVRQLNMYDFHKTRQENQENAFKNFLFKKGHKYLLKEIQRKDYKKNKETNKELYSMIQKQKSVAQTMGQPCSKIKEDSTLPMVQNQCFKANIVELKKVKNELQEKSLKLMAFKQTDFSKEMIMKAIDVLFQCGFASQKAFYQVQILKTDYELNERRRLMESMTEKFRQEEKKPEIYTAEKFDTKHSLSCFKEPFTEAKTVLFSNSQPKQSFTGFEKFQTTQVSLFNSFRVNCD